MHPSDPKFCHPYQPYDIQLRFMTSLYDCIEHGKVGIFESPTGTGKSLSLICGSLTWLRDNQRRLFEDNGDEMLDWLAEAEKAGRRRDFLREREELEDRLSRIRQQEAKRREQSLDGRPFKKAKHTKSQAELEDDEDFLLEEYDSDADSQSTMTKQHGGLSSTTQALLRKLHKASNQSEETQASDETKIIFCSRTHSQLTQFVHELRRVTPPKGLSNCSHIGPLNGRPEPVKHLSLGSRKNLCINEKVVRLSSTAAINERCLDMQKPGYKKESKCSYLPTKDNRELVDSFRDRAIASIRDIEDTARLGQELHICPYYASRPAIAPTEVLTLPYPLLLQKSARDALGVSVKDNVIIIDEAHNLMDAIADTLSVSMSFTQLSVATQQLIGYVEHFKFRLKGKNRVYITQVIRLINSIVQCLRTMARSTLQHDVAVTAEQLMSGQGADQIKPHKLLQYLHESKLTYKVEGYIDSHVEGNKHKGILMQFQSLLVALMNPTTEGCFFVSFQDGGDLLIRYALLDPREHFRDIVEDARAVILAGGTMSPMSDYEDYLFSYLPAERLATFSFGHVISKQNVVAHAVTRGPSGGEFDFTFEKRWDEPMISDLGQLLTQICQAVPDGVVCFFPSYEYLGRVVHVWRQGTPSMMDALQSRKPVFQEIKGQPSDELLRDYTQAIDASKGGLLLSVVGGKLSEGINFSDKLGRAVVVVGLPFPNANGAEWKAKIQHVEETKLKLCQEQEHLSPGEARTKAKAAGRDFYENACMRAVNQSIGRVIRHRNDYATILLVDRRFATDRIRGKLPGWIRECMDETSPSKGWDRVEPGLKAFFGAR